MQYIKIYFILGLAMAMVVLWDYRNLPGSARILTRQAGDNTSQFSRIAVEIRNWLIMLASAFFLWPVLLIVELRERKK